MCIIVVKPSGIDMPELKHCWDNNPDGAGFMFASKGKVVVRKGFMKYEHLMKELKNIENVKDLTMVLHFRIKTHGEVSPQLTHPFVVSTNKDVELATRARVKRAFVHNGIITGMGYQMKNDSDTSVFVRNYLAPLFLKMDDGYRLTYGEKKLMETILDSKGVLMYEDGTYDMFGAFTFSDGCMYSNSNYEEISYTYGKGKSYGAPYYEDDYVTDWCIHDCNECPNNSVEYCCLYNRGITKDNRMSWDDKYDGRPYGWSDNDTEDVEYCDGACMSCDLFDTDNCVEKKYLSGGEITTTTDYLEKHKGSESTTTGIVKSDKSVVVKHRFGKGGK